MTNKRQTRAQIIAAAKRWNELLTIALHEISQLRVAIGMLLRENKKLRARAGKP